MSTKLEPCVSCGSPAEWEAVVKATGPKGTREDVVPLCDPCMQRGVLALVDAATDAEVEPEDDYDDDGEDEL